MLIVCDSQDKYGAAAMRAVELNYYLGGSCHIFRELEGHEGEEFLSYFEEDLEYLYGGSESSFRHVLTNAEIDPPNLLYRVQPQADPRRWLLVLVSLGLALSLFLYAPVC